MNLFTLIIVEMMFLIHLMLFWYIFDRTDKFTIKINFTDVFLLNNVVTRKFLIRYVAQIRFPFNSVVLEALEAKITLIRFLLNYNSQII